MYKEVKYQDIEKYLYQAVLIVTATDLETKILHKEIKPILGQDHILQFFIKDKTYYLGVFGVYFCVHIQCGTMGSVGAASSIVTVRDSLNTLKSKVTIMIGIAFGVDKNNQEIGDVIVADLVVPYDNKKISNGITTYRAPAVPTSTLLLNRFRNVRTWEFLLSRRAANKIVAPIFSGEELVNDLVRRNEIEKINPLAKGGEMEGAGLYAAANGQSEWILVKGICDYADGNKDKDKDDNQVIAMSSALSLCLEVFSSITSFTHINLFPANSTPVKTLSIEPTLVNNVLFDVYDVSKEKYYLLRDIDENVIKSMNYTSIWVSGKSGRGKSLALFRNLIKGKIDYISVSLASCTGLSIDEFFYEIYVELMLKLNPSETIERITDYRTIVRKINQILLAHYPGKTIFILIDEIPLGNDERFKDFVCKICSLFISSLLSCSGVTVRYALSSIYSPEEHIPEYQSKVRNYIKFIDFADWNETECHQLVNMIESELDITVSESTKRSIVEKSSGSPRWIKNVVKNVVILGDTSDTSVDEAIKQTKCQKVI